MKDYTQAEKAAICENEGIDSAIKFILILSLWLTESRLYFPFKSEEMVASLLTSHAWLTCWPEAQGT